MPGNSSNLFLLHVDILVKFICTKLNGDRIECGRAVVRWDDANVCIIFELSSSSRVNKLRKQNFENDEILQCISCRVMINSHLICSGISLPGSLQCRKYECVCVNEIERKLDRECEENV